MLTALLIQLLPAFELLRNLRAAIILLFAFTLQCCMEQNYSLQSAKGIFKDLGIVKCGNLRVYVC